MISHASLVFIVIPSVFIRAATAPERRGGIRPQPFALARIPSHAALGFKYDCTLGRARLSTEVRQNEATTQEGLLTNSSDMLISRVRNAHDGGLFDSRCLSSKRSDCGQAETSDEAFKDALEQPLRPARA